MSLGLAGYVIDHKC